MDKEQALKVIENIVGALAVSKQNIVSYVELDMAVKALQVLRMSQAPAKEDMDTGYMPGMSVVKEKTE